MKQVLRKTVSFVVVIFLASISSAQGQDSVPSGSDEPLNSTSSLTNGTDVLSNVSDGLTSLSTSTNLPPSSFEWLAPGEDALLDRTDPVVFQWNRSDDPDQDNVTYILEITRLYDGHVTHEEVVDTVDVLDLNTTSLPDSAVHYSWTVRATDGDKTVSTSNASGSFSFLPVTSAPENDTLQPEGFSLSAAYPNPFNSMTIIRYHVDETTDVNLTVYNLLGEVVTVLKEGRVTAGSHLAAWRGEDASKQKVASGTYIVRMEAHDQQTSLRVTFVK